MAAASSASSLHEGLTCSICFKYFTEPVAIECGHSFCRVCIVQYWDETQFSCPQCGEISLKRKFTPNRELGNVAEIAKRMKAESATTTEKVCVLHQEPLKHFCKDEQKLLCATCVESKDHDATHALLTVEQAVQDYKEELETQLQTWRKKREAAIEFHAKEKNKCQNFLRKVDDEKQKFISKFEEVLHFLKKQKKIMLDRLEEFVNEEEKFIAKISGEISLTETVIRELEEKIQHPENAFLQDAENTFNRCQVWESQQPDVCSELEEKLYAFSKKYIILKKTLHAFTENLPQQLKVEWVNVTLDPDTAHCQLRVSDDKKFLTWEWNKLNLTDYPQRFSSSCCVLGYEAFTSGRHYWEVAVGEKGDWAVGVAREAVKRKESNSHTPEHGIWARKKSYNLIDNPKTIGIFLDYDGNRVMFFDAEKEAVISTCPAYFKAQKVRPFFYLEGSYKSRDVHWISLCP